MNVMLQQAMGADGEAQMHIIMGKRLTGCMSVASSSSKSSK